jgi:hypothetical protein
MPPAFTHDNDAAMIHALARTIAKIIDSRRPFGNVNVHDLGLRTVKMAERLAMLVALDDDARKHEEVTATEEVTVRVE